MQKLIFLLKINTDMITNQVQKSYKFRCYPTIDQRILLNKAFGCARFIYNFSLKTKRDAYKLDKTNVSMKELSKNITKLKNEPNYEWLKEAPAVCLQQTLNNLDKAYKNFFRSCKNKDYKFKYPTFKLKYSTRSVRFTGVEYKGSFIKLQKLGDVRIKPTQTILINPKMATITCDSIGRYFISFSCKTEVDILPMTGNEVGIDVGIKEFCFMSDGTSIDNPRYLKNQLKALKRSQRALSRSEQDSKRREKKRVKVAKIHAKISDKRSDFLHKTTTKIVKENDLIVVEDLQIKNMMKNRKLSRSIADASWGEFIRQLEYKANWYGKTLVRVNPNYTSRDCSKCGHRHEKQMHLSIRTWVCSQCGSIHDRDHNASINILQRGHDILVGIP